MFHPGKRIARSSGPGGGVWSRRIKSTKSNMKLLKPAISIIAANAVARYTWVTIARDATRSLTGARLKFTYGANRIKYTVNIRD